MHRRPTRPVPVWEIIHISTGGGGGPPGGGGNKVQNQPFTVVGVMSVKGQSGVGQDRDEVIFVPPARSDQE
jgi:hypothetical protein